MALRFLRAFALVAVSATLLWCGEIPQKYWIYFRDKDPGASQQILKGASQEQLAAQLGISPRALARRAKVLPPGQLISAADFPISQSNTDQLVKLGIPIINASRWFNAVSAMLTAAQRTEVSSLPCVASVVPVRSFTRRDLPRVQDLSLAKTSSLAITQLHNYGPSFEQLDQIKVVDIHNLRITGRGVLVGMLDDGFRWRTIESTKNMKVIAEYDFIQHDSVTSNEYNKTPPDEVLQDEHGTIILSTVGGHFEGQIVSPAFGASFILAKTEYYPTETNIEEDNWAAGIEWEEQHGVDVVSSSLGYNIFDATDANGNPQYSYTYADMNGRTSVVAKAAVAAARLGVVVCTAMGNEGNNDWHYLITPADADSIISVGAANASGTIAPFSSVGPTSDGRTKPDVLAQGVKTYASDTDELSFQGGPGDVYGYFQGTSLSTPLVAGSAALILSAHPELTPIQVRNALRNTASNAAAPNDTLGWGIINAYEAMLSCGMVLSTDPEVTLTSDGNTVVGVFAVSNSPVKKNAVNLLYSTNAGATFNTIPMTLTDVVDSSKNSGKYIGVIPEQVSGTDIKFYVSAADSTNITRVTPYGAPTNLFDVNTEISTVRPANAPTGFALYQNYPNPFNPTTLIKYSLAKSNFTTLKIYDILGREVATLVNAYEIAGAEKTVQFNASGFASGVYFYRLKSGEFNAVKKFVILK